MGNTCYECMHYYRRISGTEGIYGVTHHCTKKMLQSVYKTCASFKKRQIIDDISHNPNAKWTGFSDYRGQDLFEGDYMYIPNSMLERERVARIVYDIERKEWRLQDQSPFSGSVELKSFIINVNLIVTPTAYKVTEKRIIELYK